MRNWVRNLLSPRISERVAGAPTSGSGASAFYLWWDLPYGERLNEISVTLDVQRRPEVDRLVTFAVQAAFVKPSGGSCHFGLQHQPEVDGRNAVLWNGYDAKGSLLEVRGDQQSSPANEDGSRAFEWSQGTPYRFTVERGEEEEDGRYPWKGSITDLNSGESHIVCEILNSSPHLRAPVMYVESYSPCDGPGFEARWSNAVAVSTDGGVRTVQSMRVDYQPHAAGGCTNTNSTVEQGAFVQRVGQMRSTKPGSTIRLG